ncbi:MAG: hypothetical protein Q9216_006525 [Gyalolechia sp. 2 TL-2023]
MQPKKVLLKIASAIIATLLSIGAQGQALFDNGKITGNETIYGALKVIDIPQYPTAFVNYPDINAELRKSIYNGGLDPTCSSCNETGCLCPDLTHHNISFGGLCEHCRGMEGGGLRCYCSPALDGTPCNTTGPTLTACNDHAEECNNTLPLYFCEPQNWDQDPALTDLATASVVYDFQKITVLPPGLGGAVTNTVSAAQQTEQALKARVASSGASKAFVEGLKGMKLGSLVVGIAVGVVALHTSAF